MNTPAQQLKAKLESTGLPFKNIDCYGRQIVVTAQSRDAAIKWGSLLGKFAKVRRVAFETVDEAKEQQGTCLRPTYVKVWRTFAAIA
jgi:hypothetical protein